MINRCFYVIIIIYYYYFVVAYGSFVHAMAAHKLHVTIPYKRRHRTPIPNMVSPRGPCGEHGLCGIREMCQDFYFDSKLLGASRELR